jgi:hypothetical protein
VAYFAPVNINDSIALASFLPVADVTTASVQSDV